MEGVAGVIICCGACSLRWGRRDEGGVLVLRCCHGRLLLLLHGLYLRRWGGKCRWKRSQRRQRLAQAELCWSWLRP